MLKNKKILSLLIIFIILISLASTALATSSGTAPDSGTGSGSSVAFALVESKPANGATNVDVDSTIWLLFNKNVVNMTVSDINKANITLKDEDGNKVSAAVTMKDDQIEPEYRREIIVVPSSALDPRTTYYLILGSAMRAKNGQTLGEDVTLTFKTAGVAASANEAATTNNSAGSSSSTDSSTSSDNIVTANIDQDQTTTADTDSEDLNNIDAKSEQSDKDNSSTVDRTEKKDHDKNSGGHYWLVALIVVIVGGGTATAVYLKKKHKK